MADYHSERRRRLAELPKEQLIGMLEDAAKNWLAHDGLWFLAAEQQHGMPEAIALDQAAWRRFTVIEAQRIMKRHGIAEGSGLEGLREALRHRLYAQLNVQQVEWDGPRALVLRMNHCRVQAARARDKRPDFPCKDVGLTEYTYFAKTIDPRIETECVACPPDTHPAEWFCAWRFSIESADAS